MGYLTALDTIDQLGPEELSRAVSLHFSSNCYPPVPQYMVDVAVEAIEHCAHEDSEFTIELPEGVSYQGKEKVKAYEIVEGLYLEAFVAYLVDYREDPYDD